MICRKCGYPIGNSPRCEMCGHERTSFASTWASEVIHPSPTEDPDFRKILDMVRENLEDEKEEVGADEAEDLDGDEDGYSSDTEELLQADIDVEILRGFQEKYRLKPGDVIREGYCLTYPYVRVNDIVILAMGNIPRPVEVHLGVADVREKLLFMKYPSLEKTGKFDNGVGYGSSNSTSNFSRIEK